MTVRVRGLSAFGKQVVGVKVQSRALKTKATTAVMWTRSWPSASRFTRMPLVVQARAWPTMPLPCQKVLTPTAQAPKHPKPLNAKP